MTLRCIAIDEEQSTHTQLIGYCGRYGDIELECHTHVEQAMVQISNECPDVVFIGINLNDNVGLSIASQMPKNTCVIFITDYAKFALAAFNAGAVDFLHKPISYERFKLALDKATRFTESGTRDIIVVRSDHKNMVVELAEIVYVEAMDNYVKMFRHDGSCILTQLPLKVVNEMLPSEKFVRIHRSFIVSKANVDKYTARNVILITGRTIPVGRTYYKNMVNSL